MDIVGLCSHCGKPGAMFTCSLCGRNVCSSCFDIAHSVCCVCKVGKQL